MNPSISNKYKKQAALQQGHRHRHALTKTHPQTHAHTRTHTDAPATPAPAVAVPGRPCGLWHSRNAHPLPTPLLGAHVSWHARVCACACAPGRAVSVRKLHHAQGRSEREHLICGHIASAMHTQLQTTHAHTQHTHTAHTHATCTHACAQVCMHALEHAHT
jgi:hypothetical protein